MGILKANQSVVLVGGPDAGKTNYLGRLWLALDAETGVIQKDGLPPQVEYLRSIGQSLNAGQFAPRSAPGTFESSEIPVKWNHGHSSGQLIVPDCAGEQWERIHKEREWDSNWESAVATMTGCILFFRVDSDHNEQPLDWSNHAEVMKCLEQAREPNARPPKLPTQVVLVDWLQCLSAAYRAIHDTEAPLRVSVAFSAWDMAPMEFRDADPDKYLSEQLPLLHDFLEGNPSLFCPKTFGVSSTGGVLTDQDTPFMNKYFSEEPNNNGYVVLSNGRKVVKSNDLTLPLVWAFGCDCSEFLHARTSSS